MNREFKIKNKESFDEEIEGNLEISNLIVNTILDNINTTKKHIYALSIILEDTGEGYDFTINRDSFRDTLNKNLYIQERYEQYEVCNKILKALEKLN
jgi:hypothetical protein